MVQYPRHGDLLCRVMGLSEAMIVSLDAQY